MSSRLAKKATLLLLATFTALASASVSPETALRFLTNGNARFAKEYLRQDGQSQKDVQRVSVNQNPHAIVLACSDSRTPPELIFDQKLGELFTVRNLGPTLDASAIQSIEYAVENYGTRLILIMGHTKPRAHPNAQSAHDLAKELLNRSAPLAQKWQKNELKVVPAVYDLQNGRVAFSDQLRLESPRVSSATNH